MDINKDFKIDITSKLKHLLFNVFKEDKIKQDVLVSTDRINFACPYCKDSDSSIKKRGNLFWDSLHYYCFNGGCNTYKSLIDLLKDFNEEIDMNNKLEIYDHINSNKSIKHINYNMSEVTNMFNTDIEKYSIDENEFLLKLNLHKINEKTPRAYTYLKSRNLHNYLDRIVYHDAKKQIYILNYYKNRVIGAFVRNLIVTENNVRYYIFNIEKLHNFIGNKIEIDEKIKKISVIYNLYNVDYRKPFYIFEGALDSMFIPNSIALGGLKKDIINFKDIKNANYFYDNDQAGKSQAIEKIKENQSVFLWTKFLKELNLNKFKIKDLNDLVNLSFKHNEDYMKNIKNFFSSESYDLYYI